jgi:uncharacterized protein (TIGR00290 family)
MNDTPVALSWSSGKDCALALAELCAAGVPIATLLTTVTTEYDRVSMHGTRRALLEAQAASLGLPLEVVELSPKSSNEEYEARMGEALARLRERGIETVAFGDLLLEDVRAYREAQLARAGMRALFPLWGRDTTRTAREIIARGFRAVLTCVDGEVLDERFAGRDYDARLLAELPAGVDPCGENGEFHTFVHDGPGFRSPVRFTRGEVVLRDGRFWYCDLQ